MKTCVECQFENNEHSFACSKYKPTKFEMKTKKINRPNTAYMTIWKKTHTELKKLSLKRKEPMTVVIQRLVENAEKLLP